MDFSVKNSSVDEPSNEPLFDDLFFSDLRKREFSRIDEKNHCYLDFTGGNLYPESLLNTHFEYLKRNVYGNPHSGNPTSQLSTLRVAEARHKVLQFFNASDDYFCIFTPNASGALRIVGESYPFDPQSCFLLTADNHNSVNGIREFCKSKGGEVKYLLLNYEDLTLNRQSTEASLRTQTSYHNKLFAFPAQSNVSGVKHSLDWIHEAKQNGWDVLLDAAAFVPTSVLDLKEVKPDFVSVSFYKIFGYPTGLGCLLVKKDKFLKLQKPSFFGGTVSMVSVLYEQHFLMNNHERFEDGTVDYLGIPAVENGLEFILAIGVNRISQRVKSLSSYFLSEIKMLKHSNNEALTIIFGTTDWTQKGGTFILNFKDKNGKIFPFEEVEQLANQRNISIRTGCFCNPGIDEIFHCVTKEELTRYFTTRDYGDYHDMFTFLGKMRGAVRISFGWATVKNDIDRFIEFAKSFIDKTQE